MTKQVIGIGSAPNDGSGDPLRNAFNKCNDNFTEVYDAITALGGSSDLIVNILYADLLTAIAGSELVPGTFYQITDKGDRGVILQALSTNVMSNTGVRRMLCPFTYATTLNDNNWLGVWNSALTPSADDLVIWGGLVWKNLTGAVGTASDSITLDGTNWEVVSKSTFANNEYREMIFGIMFDFDYGTYTKQWDGKGNIITSFGSGFAFNTCDVTDWNLDSVSNSFYDNICKGVFNNANTGAIYKNHIAGSIYNNTNGDIIGNLNNESIHTNSNGGSIQNNSNNGIINNTETVNRTIYVSPADSGGSDITGDGTLLKPYATPLKALQSIQNNINTDIALTISIHSGTYAVDINLISYELKRFNILNGGSINFIGSLTAYKTGLTLTARSPDAYIYDFTGYSASTNEFQEKLLLVGSEYHPIASNATTSLIANTALSSGTSIYSTDVVFNITGQFYYPAIITGTLRTANINFNRIKFNCSDLLRFFTNGSCLPTFTECIFKSTSYYSLTDYSFNFEFYRTGFYTSVTTQIFAIVSDKVLWQDCIFQKTGSRGSYGFLINNNENSGISYFRFYSRNYIGNVATGISFSYGTYLFSKHRTIANNNFIIDATTGFLIGVGTKAIFMSNYTCYILNMTTLVSERTNYGKDMTFILPTLIGTPTNYTSSNIRASGLINIDDNNNISIAGITTSGTATLSSGTVTINTKAVSSTSKILLSMNTPSGTPGFLSIGTIVNGTSFIINSTSATDESTVNWQIIK